MPAYDDKILTINAPTKITEVNTLRESLTIQNPNTHILVLSDNDQPVIAAGRVHGYIIYGYSTVVLKAKDGDRPGRAFWLFTTLGTTVEAVVYEGMKEDKPRVW